MPKSCYLHVGLHKTASSSFQSTCANCANNIGILQEAGIAYPIFSCAAANKPNIQNHSVPIHSLFHKKQNIIEWIGYGAFQVISKRSITLMKASCRILTSSDDLIISGEDVSNMSKESLFNFINKIKSYNYEIKAIALIRSPYSFACSAMQQRIKGGNYFEMISLNNSVPTSFNDEQVPLRSNNVKKLSPIFKKIYPFMLLTMRESIYMDRLGFFCKNS